MPKYTKVLKPTWNGLWRGEGRREGWKFTEANQNRIIRDRDAYVPHCVPDAFPNATNAFRFDRYRYEYWFVGEGDDITEFEVSVRPLSYGETRLRSYLAVETYTAEGNPHKLDVYATPEDREATTSDPLALAQELGMSNSLHEASIEWCGAQPCP